MQQIILIAVAVAAPFLTWGLSDLKAKWIDIPAAERTAADKATQAAASACNGRIAAIQRQLDEKAAEARRLADEAERAVGPTPVEKAELQDLCNRSASCRERLKPGGESQ